MGKINLIAIGAGILAYFVITIPIGFLAAFLSLHIFDEIAIGVNFADERQFNMLMQDLFTHPLMITFIVIAIILSIGISGYIVAFVAKKAFITQC